MVNCRHFVGLTTRGNRCIFAPSNRTTMLNEKKEKTEKYEARSKMLEKLIEQIYENQENDTNLKQRINNN